MEQGAIGAAAVVGGTAVVIAAAPEAAAVVTGALFIGGVAGITTSIISVATDSSSDNIGYNLGALTGGALVGGASGEEVAAALSPEGYQPPAGIPPLTQSTLENAWRNPEGDISPLAFLHDWLFGNPNGVDPMKTGPDTWGAIGALTGSGSLWANLFGRAHLFGRNCHKGSTK